MTTSPDNVTPAAATAPQPMLESQARTMAMLVHIVAAVAAIMSGGTLSFIAPLVIWLIYRERSALVDFHGKQNLNLQLTTLAVVVGGVVVGFATLLVGFLVTGPLMLAYLVYAVIISIVAGVKASRGEYYRIPLSIPFIR